MKNKEKQLKKALKFIEKAFFIIADFVEYPDKTDLIHITRALMQIKRDLKLSLTMVKKEKEEL